MFRFVNKLTVRTPLAHAVSPKLLRQFSTNSKAILDNEYEEILGKDSKVFRNGHNDYYLKKGLKLDPYCVDSVPSEPPLRFIIRTAEDARRYGEERAFAPLVLVDGNMMSPNDLLSKFASSRAYVGYTAQKDPKKRVHTKFCDRMNVPKKLALASGVKSIILAKFTAEEFPNPLERTIYARNCEGAVQDALHQYGEQRLWWVADPCKNPKVACKEEATLSIYFAYIVHQEMLPRF